MTRAQAEAEFWTFVHTRSGRLRLIARTVCGDAHQADDLVQEALERTWLRWSRWDADPFAWTRTVVVNLAIDQTRRRRRRREHVLGATDPGQESRADEVETKLFVESLLAGLTAKERATVVLRYLEDLSEADAAAELGSRR